MFNFHATPLCPQKLALNFTNKWRSSVGIVRSRTKGHEVFLIFLIEILGNPELYYN
jgi:hypothetical protein